MLDQLNRYFTAVHRLRRSERSLVRSGALMNLQELAKEVHHPKLKARINTAINQHLQAEARAS